MSPLHATIVTLICLAFVVFALLALMGKLDRWYAWSLGVEDKPSEQQVMRWRMAFAVEVLLALVLIIVFNILDVADKYSSWAFFALCVGMALIERLWIRKV
ncbi:MAG: hypothetical protein IKV04_03555 [Alistipes sp.]|nr:hypothetical protein [Alistipes sp.]